LVKEPENMSNDAKRSPSGDSGVPLISVVLPVYNGEKYLAESIESVLAQTFTNFELIMIDDGSTDGSLQIMRKYEQNDARVRVITRENRGLSTTLNDSIDISRGELLARMDQDDIALPHRFEKQLQWLELSGADICGSWVKYFGGVDQHTCRYYESDESIKIDMLFKSPFAHPSVMMRTDLVKKLRYDIRCEKAEDYDLWVRTAQAGWKMSNVQEVLLKYRRHETQITTKAVAATQTVSAEIRDRYWTHAAGLFGISAGGSQQVQKLILLDPETIMSIANIAFNKLLTPSTGEARRALIDNISRLYLKAAGNMPDVNSNWLELMNQYSLVQSIRMGFKLRIISLLRVKNGSQFYFILKKLYNKIF